MINNDKIYSFDENDYSNFFQKVTGFYPYNFQIDIGKKMLEGKNIIMQAPTGSGKTWASIIPFLYTLYKNIEFPKKLVYSLPLRVLANSLFKEVHEKTENISALLGRKVKITIQTGETSQDPYFLEGDIIFTTIDQSISSMLSIPLSLSINQGNINPGAIFSSYLIFDEFHLLEVKRALSTVHNILNKVKNITPVCLMTATLSDKLLDNYCKSLNSEKVSISESELGNISSQVNKVRNILATGRALCAEDIIRSHKQKTIVICNTVAKCRAIYMDLKRKKDKYPELNDTKILCIHSQIFSRDRKIKEELIKQYFSKNSNENAILIATQVIEVGIDITCETMHTEVSPINSFLQRIGRCARYGGENGKTVYGIIYVYDVEKFNNDGAEKKNPYLPYDEALCIETLKKLSELDEKENLDFFKGQKLVDSILTPVELDSFNLVNNADHDRFTEIRSCWLKPDRMYASSLIREIDAVNVIITSDYNSITNPYKYDTVSINRYSLIPKIRNIEKEEEDDWIVRVITESNFDDDLFGKYSSLPVGVDDVRLKYESILILNGKYTYYDNEIGLNFDGIGDKQSTRIENQRVKENFIITKDTYEEHIEYMLQAYEDIFRENLSYTLRMILNKYNINFDIDEIIRFMIIVHDYGKLNRKWQDEAQNYQRGKGNYSKNEFLAHTDYNPEIDTKIKLPKHAGMGAYFAFGILEEGYEEPLCKVLLNSIVKHHSAKSFSCEKYKIKSGAKEVMEGLIKKHCPNLANNIDFNDEIFDKSTQRIEFDSADIISFGKINSNYEALLYFIMVRILRICDQKSFEYKGRWNDERRKILCP